MPSSSPHIGVVYDLEPARTEFRDGMLRAVDFEDGYFGFEDGLAEARMYLSRAMTLPTVQATIV